MRPISSTRYRPHARTSTRLPECVRFAALDTYVQFPPEQQRVDAAWVSEIYARSVDAHATSSHFSWRAIEVVDIAVGGESTAGRGMW